MFHHALNSIQDSSLKTLFSRLRENGYYEKEIGHLTDEELAQAWDYFYDGEIPKIVHFLECRKFIFEKKPIQEFGLGMKDWNRIVRQAKDLLAENDPETAKEELQKRYTFLASLDATRAIEQAQEEFEEEI